MFIQDVVKLMCMHHNAILHYRAHAVYITYALNLLSPMRSSVADTKFIQEEFYCKRVQKFLEPMPILAHFGEESTWGDFNGTMEVYVHLLLLIMYVFYGYNNS